MIYMICYDITDSKRRQKVAKTLMNYGIRAQKSFFQCEISQNMLENIKTEILSTINIHEDYFYIYPLCSLCTKKAKEDGTGTIIKIKSFEII